MNAPLPATPTVVPFYLDAEPGTRFCLFHAPNPRVPARGAILYVHPLAEEMNKSRRMAALQARAFAALGFAVLQADLYGCGDSCGDFSDARWPIWKRDLATASDWLAAHTEGPMHLWGMRLGALLALDFAVTRPPAALILWQPVLDGRTCITQFLRQRLAAHMLVAEPEALSGTAGLRQQLAAQGSIEIGGYELADELARQVEACDAASLQLPACHIDWLAVKAPMPGPVAANVARLAQRWSARGVTLAHAAVPGLPFWASAEITECPALLVATCALFETAVP